MQTNEMSATVRAALDTIRDAIAVLPEDIQECIIEAVQTLYTEGCKEKYDVLEEASRIVSRSQELAEEANHLMHENSLIIKHVDPTHFKRSL